MIAFLVWGWRDSLRNRSEFRWGKICCGQHYGGGFVRVDTFATVFRWAVTPSPPAWAAERTGIAYDEHSRVQPVPPPAFFRGEGRGFPNEFWGGLFDGKK